MPKFLGDAKKELTEILSGLVPEEHTQQIAEGVEKLYENLREEIAEGLHEEYKEISETVKNLKEQKDELFNRAVEAEKKVKEIQEESASLIDETRELVKEEYEGKITQLESKIAAFEDEKDELHESIVQKYEELRVQDRDIIVKKIEEFLEIEVENKLNEMKGINELASTEEIEAFKKICGIMREYNANYEDVPSIEDTVVTKKDKEIASLRAQNKQYENRITRLSIELDSVRENKMEDLNDDEDDELENEVEKTIEKKVVKKKVSPKLESSRASELFLREALETSEGVSGEGDEEDWLDDLEESRDARKKISENAFGKGIAIDEEDIVKEVVSSPDDAQALDESFKRIVSGTDDLTRADALKLSGIV